MELEFRYVPNRYYLNTYFTKMTPLQYCKQIVNGNELSKDIHTTSLKRTLPFRNQLLLSYVTNNSNVTCDTPKPIKFLFFHRLNLISTLTQFQFLCLNIYFDFEF